VTTALQHATFGECLRGPLEERIDDARVIARDRPRERHALEVPRPDGQADRRSSIRLRQGIHQSAEQRLNLVTTVATEL